MADTLNFQVILDKTLDRKVAGVVAFGDFETDDPIGTTAIYSDVDSFFRDLILGRPLPLTFVAKEMETFGVVLAIALFLYRDLAIHPNTPGFLANTNLADSGVIGMAHVDRDLSAFFKFSMQCLRNADTSKQQRRVLDQVVGWIRDYILHGTFPALPPTSDLPRVLDIGTDGFVLATTSGDMAQGWEELFRMGYLRGLLLKSQEGERWVALAARKSAYLQLNLARAAAAYNEAEGAMNEPATWEARGNWLFGPERGTLLTPSSLVRILVRA